MKARESRCSVPTVTLRRLHASGLSCRAVAERVGLHHGTVHKRLSRRGVRRPKDATARFTQEALDRAAAIYRQGLGLAFVARFLNLRCKTTAARCLRAHGVAIR